MRGEEDVLGCDGSGATHSAIGEAETLLDGRGQLADAAAVAGRQAARKAPVVAAVNNKDKALRGLPVVAPQGADLVQATHVPNSAADALVPDNETSTKAGSRRVPPSLSSCAWQRLSIPAVSPLAAQRVLASASTGYFGIVPTPAAVIFFTSTALFCCR